MEGFVCPHLYFVCQKYKKNLINHLEIKYGKPNIKYSNCDKTSIQNYNLKLHTGNIHNIIASHL